jgi:ribosomal protein S18 acetylase RimI-like enzyme
MAEPSADLEIRPLSELDIGDIVRIDEKVTGRYRPDEWERRITYYIRRDPDASLVAEQGGKVIGFMLGEMRSGEFGLDEPTGWVAAMGVDPEAQGSGVGRRLGEAMLAYFRESGATKARTLVDEEMKDVGRFFEALGFKPAPLRPLILPL